MDSPSAGRVGKPGRRHASVFPVALTLLLSCFSIPVGEARSQRPSLAVDGSLSFVMPALALQVESPSDEWLDIWKNYRGAVIGVAALVGVLVALILALLIQRTQRIHSERSLAERLKFEKLLSEISAALIAVDLERVDEEVVRALSRVVDVLDLERCALFVLFPAEGRTRITHQAESESLAPLDRESQRAHAPALYEDLRAGKAVKFAGVAAPGSPGAASLSSIAVTISDEIVRGMLFAPARGRRRGTADLIPRLRLVGEILVPTLVGKRTEAALRASEERYREVVESQTDLICRFTPDMTLTFVNEAYCRYFGRTREQLIGRSFLELIPEGPREATKRYLMSLLENPRVEVNEHEVTRPDGTIGWHQWTNYAIRGRDGRIYEFQGIGQDITDRKHAEEAERGLAQASRLALLGELTASIAHEINQPLGAILSNTDAAEMLLDSGPQRLDEVRAILNDIRREDLRASDVIHHTRRLLQRRPMDTQVLAVNDVVADALRFVGPDARRRGVSLEAHLEKSLPKVQGDRVSLEQVIVNLLLNGMDAMARQPDSRRRVTVRTAIDAGETVEVQVADTGHGIPREILPRLFESFVTTRQDGVGLGLSISRSIIEAHGGRIQAENNADGGATIRFFLPIPPPSHGRSAEALEVS
jgi:PAS domain S-box-containing protein